VIPQPRLERHYMPSVARIVAAAGKACKFPDLQLSVGSATTVGVMLPIIFLVKKTTLAAQSRH
jgi:hypothetical protein